MRKKRSRRGIEWKILVSILSVGIVPMSITIFVNYAAARIGRAQEVESHLNYAARTKAEGIRFAVSGRSAFLTPLINDPDIISVLQPDAGGVPPTPESIDALREHLRGVAASMGEPGTSIRVLDSRGQLLLTTDDSMILPLPNQFRLSRMQGASVWNVAYSDSIHQFVMEIGARVRAPESPESIGFVSLTSDAGPLQDFVFGTASAYTTSQSAREYYRLAFVGPDMITESYYIEREVESGLMQVRSESLDDRLAKQLSSPSNRDFGIMPYVQTVRDGSTAYVAYHRLFPGSLAYILVYRPASSLFPDVNFWSVIAIVVSFSAIAVLCLIAYRKIHNDIARPVALLNEGAQIIRQGDLELKLKISTGDELEDLATSFNEMAMALKAKMLELELSEERYRSLVTSMRDGIFQADINGVLEFLNPAGMELFGLHGEASSMRVNLRQLFHDPNDFERAMTELKAKGFLERTRIWMRRKDRRSICVELTANRMYDDDGEFIGTEGILRDVTKNIRLEQEAHERLERIVAINQIASAINSSLEAGRLYESLVVELRKFVDFDSSSLSLFKTTDDGIELRTLWPVSDDPSQQSVRQCQSDACSEWVLREKQSLVVNDFSEVPDIFSDNFPDGSKSCICVPLYATGRIIGTLNMGSRRTGQFTKHDIEVLDQLAPHVAVAIRNAQLLENLQASLEEVTRAREKLHDANEELKTLDEMKTNLLSNVSHELRTPLVAVMGYTDMIRGGKAGPINDTQREYLEICLRNIDRLVTLIENLLDFSRLNRGTETLVFDTIDLLDCANAAIEQVRPVADSREIEVDLVTTEESVLIEGDKAKLIQVINNLLSNAVKFNHNGGRVSVEVRVTPDTAEVTVTDTGIGIPPEAVDKVFTRFYQYDSSSTRKYGGTGIGLSIAQDIARLHGSRITVSSEVGVGTSFRFILSRKAPAKMDDFAPYELPSPSDTHMLVELVSTDRALSAHIRSLLETESIQVLTAGNETHAVALAAKHTPDCILVDIDQYRMGPTLIDELLADPQTNALPIILLSNSDELFAKYRSRLVARVKRGFRKSTLLSAIRVALNADTGTGEPIGEKILCVDDDAEILTFMGRCLEQGGFTVDLCSSGEEALDKVMSRQYSLVLMDISMPGLDGWETCRRIKTNPQLAGCKVCMVTAKPTDSTRNSTMQGNADGYLLKPFRPEDLLDLVRSMGMTSDRTVSP